MFVRRRTDRHVDGVGGNAGAAASIEKFSREVPGSGLERQIDVRPDFFADFFKLRF